MRKNLTTIILIIILLAGLSLLLYPTISDYWNSLHQSRAVASYVKEVQTLDTGEKDRLLEAAREYNRQLAARGTVYQLSEAEKAEYEKQLRLEDTDVMGYIEVPGIKCTLPIYHGTDEGVLQVALGHLEWTSLPVGGESTHCVISGHRGLPSAKLFTNLDQLEEGDIFMLNVLGETLTYEVDQIRIVLPEETEELRIVEGKDYCTLMTCTPYGVNTHRLLVRGHRMANIDNSGRVTADAMQIDPVIVAPVAAIPMLLALLIYLLVKTGRRKEKVKSGAGILQNIIRKLKK